MKKQPNKNESDGFVGYKYASKDIHCNGIISMQGMIIYSAAVGIEKWICKNVIHIHQHRGEKYKIIPLPIFFIIPVRNETYGDEVEEVMDEGLEHSLQLSVISYQMVVLQL